jgi:hypothetical protein
MLMMIMIMSMGETVSELLPPTCLLFIPQEIYELGEPWGNDTDRVRHLIDPPGLWQSYQHIYLVAKQEELAKKIINLALQIIFVHTSKGYLTCCKMLRHGADCFTSSRNEGVLRIFIALTNPSSSVGFEPAKLGSNGKHVNHYTTEDDSRRNIPEDIFITLP